jgi:NADH dehydrogenase
VVQQRHDLDNGSLTATGSRVRRVVILGGGFAGVSTAQRLTADLRRQGRLVGARPGGIRGAVTQLLDAAPGRRASADGGGPVEVVLINRDNYFVFQPLLADIISGTIETTHVVVPLRRMLRGASVEVGVVDRIDLEAREVVVRRRLDGRPFPVSYDALVIALGSVTDFSAVEGMAEHALGIRTLGDAFYLRNRALDVLEEARIETDPARRAQLLTFVVVGGGSTGVEVAAELHDLVNLAARSFTDSDRAAAPIAPRVVLVHGGPELLPSLGSRLGRYTERKLRGRGVDLRLGHRLVRVTENGVVLDDGTAIESATVVSTVGNAPHPALRDLPVPHDGRGWITPDPTFALAGVPDVWALGDVASIVDPATGAPMPATAQHAIREGPHAARNVLARLDGRPQTPFSYGQLGMLVSLGRFNGVGEVLGIKVSGLIGWFLWRSYYLLRLPSFERKVRVAVDWTLDWFLQRDIVEINVRRTRTRPIDALEEVRGEPVSTGAREVGSDQEFTLPEG